MKMQTLRVTAQGSFEGTEYTIIGEEHYPIVRYLVCDIGLEKAIWFKEEEVELIEEPSKEIDWEERLYEISKLLFVSMSADNAVMNAKKLINELKKQNNG